MSAHRPFPLFVFLACLLPTAASAEALTFTLDPKLKPRPGHARLTDEHGHVADFVTGQLLLVSRDAATLDRVAGAIGAKTVRVVDPGLPDGVRFVLAGVRPPRAKPADLRRHVRKVHPHVGGQIRVSSRAGLDLLALAGDVGQRFPDVQVTLNLVFHPAAVAHRSTADGREGSAGWHPDAFRWPYMRRGGAMDHGVAEAWRMLTVTGLYGRRVRLAVLDGGFIDTDLPRDTITTGGFGIPNPLQCGGHPCPWHGTAVAHAAAGLADNRVGAAGAGSPVVAPVLVQSADNDLFSLVAYLLEDVPAALGGRPEVANVSSVTDLPAAACTLLCPGIDTIGESIRRSGILLFASAGNAGQDVDAQECRLGYCWERAATLPCEARGVECVGGLAWDSNRRAPFSNHGRDVDLFGPYTVWAMTPDPERPGVMLDTARQANGTSFSSPFVAGCAAMVRAVAPDLSPDEVARLLRDTAHTGSPDATVTRWLDCHEAVRQALGGDAPPYVRIITPVNRQSVRIGAAGLELRAEADDHEDGAPRITWQSHRDGLVGEGPVIRVDRLRPGLHAIRAVARDRGGWQVSDRVVIEVWE